MSAEQFNELHEVSNANDGREAKETQGDLLVSKKDCYWINDDKLYQRYQRYCQLYQRYYSNINVVLNLSTL